MEASVAIPLVVRAIERLLIVAGGVMLIAIGYVTIRRRSRKEPQGEVSLQHGTFGGLLIKNQGPGFLALALGAALLAFSLAHGTVSVDPARGVVERFFSKSEADRARHVGEVSQLRYLEGLCNNKALPGIVECSQVRNARKALATIYFPDERIAYDRAVSSVGSTADPLLIALFGD